VAKRLACIAAFFLCANAALILTELPRHLAERLRPALSTPVKNTPAAPLLGPQRDPVQLYLCGDPAEARQCRPRSALPSYCRNLKPGGAPCE
jgi:hypothetical protein